MKKRYLIFSLMAIIFLSSCSKNEEYVSKRHPEENGPEINYKSVKNEKSSENLANAVLIEENISSDVNSSEQEEQNEENPLVGNYVTVGDVTNMRGQANTQSDILTQLTPGDSLYVESVENNWAYVSFNGIEGYVMAELLQLQ